jgi:hypothetical protein
MKKYLILFLFPISLFATSDATDVHAVRVPDAKGNLHNAGDIRDVVKNYASLKTEILADAKAKIEARIVGSKPTDELASMKTEIDMIESAGGTVDSTKKSLVTNSVTIETQKKADKAAESAGK